MATIGESIQAYEKSMTDEANATAALAQATTVKADADAASTTAKHQLKTDLHVVGPVFVVATGSTFRVYVPDESADGFTVLTPAPADTAVPPPEPAPTP